MKQYIIYKNIRVEPLIFGLEIKYFLVFLVSVLSSSLLLMLTFNWFFILFFLFGNPIVFLGVKLLQGKRFKGSKVFPQVIMNKGFKIDYE